MPMYGSHILPIASPAILYIMKNKNRSAEMGKDKNKKDKKDKKEKKGKKKDKKKKK